MSTFIRIDAAQSRLRLNARGEWLLKGDPFENEKITAFFHRAIRRDDEGNYYLYNSHKGRTEHVYFDVEDTAWFITGVRFDEGTRQFRVVLNNGADLPLDLRTIRSDARGVVYCRVLEDEPARFLPGALMQLSEYVKVEEGDPESYYIDRSGETVYLERQDVLPQESG